VLPVSLFVEESRGNIKFRVAFDTLNTKSSKKYEPFAPSATHTASKREEEL
jgi:DNA repair photolyase